MKELKLIPPNDPRVNNAIAPFVDDMLKDEDIKDRQELSDAMFEAMTKYGGIGLSANQVGLPFNMFVIGGHPSIEKGLKMKTSLLYLIKAIYYLTSLPILLSMKNIRTLRGYNKHERTKINTTNRP